MYHVDRKLDIPKKLDDWATIRSRAYLSIHAEKSLQVETINTDYLYWANQTAITYAWNKVIGSKVKQHRSTKPIKASKKKAQASAKNTFTKASDLMKSSTELPLFQKRKVILLRICLVIKTSLLLLLS